jgi:hypothetical protein
MDGENLKITEFLSFLDYIRNSYNIEKEKISFISLCPTKHIDRYTNEVKKQSIFLGTGSYIGEVNTNLVSSKFIGLMIGRYSHSRLRLMYEIDKSFTNDSFLIWQPKLEDVSLYLTGFTNIYQTEIDWLTQKIFEEDIKLADGFIPWPMTTSYYSNVWNKYQIEIVAETEVFDNYFFTEKTGRCIATGKPFVLFSGQGSLSQLRAIGFKTFDSILDESYDICPTPAHRINSIIDSLTELYRNPNREEKIKGLYEIAKQNIEIYEKLRSNDNKQI